MHNLAEFGDIVSVITLELTIEAIMKLELNIRFSVKPIFHLTSSHIENKQDQADHILPPALNIQVS